MFGACLEKFAEVWSLFHPGLDCLVFGDQLGAHQNVESVAVVLQKGVRPIFLPSNTPHFTQPLDSTPFAMLKKKIKIESGKAVFDAIVSGNKPNLSIYAGVYKAIEETFNEKVIKSGFEKTGIWPWNPDLILENANQNLKNKVTCSMEETKQIAVDAMTTVLENSRRESGVREESVVRQRGKIPKYGLFTGEKLVEHTKTLEEEKKEKEDALEKRKREVEEKQQMQKGEREKKRCCVDGCKVCQFTGTSNWKNCGICDARFCKKHFQHYKAHLNTHKEENLSENDDTDIE